MGFGLASMAALSSSSNLIPYIIDAVDLPSSPSSPIDTQRVHLYLYLAEAQQRQPNNRYKTESFSSPSPRLTPALAAVRRRLTAATLALTTATKLPAATLASTASVLAAVPSH